MPPDNRRQSPVGAAVIGAVAGVSLTTRWGVGAMVIGGLVGAVALGLSDVVARARQRPGQIPALWSRIIAAGAIAAPLGWAFAKLFGANPIVVGLVAGLAAGALGL